MGVDYKRLEFELYGLLLRARELLSALPDSGEMDVLLDGELERIKTKKYNVAVVGEFRRGKSSLINALLGLSVLPADATPTTATVNRITYGDEPAATVYFKDGSSRRLESIDELPNYVTKLSDEREAVAKTVREAVVEYPIVICQNHVDIIDTPGLSDDDEMTKVTIGLLKSIDAAIVAVSALAPFAESEKKFVAELIANRGVTNILFVVTFIDMLDEDEYDRVFAGIKARIREMTLSEVCSRHPNEDWIQEKAHRILDEPAVFGVSAKKALKAFVSNDRRLLAESRFPSFKEELFTILTAEQSVNMAQKAIQTLRDAALWEQTQYETQIAAARARLERIQALPGLVERYRAQTLRRVDALLVGAQGDLAKAQKPKIGDPELLPFFIAELSEVRIRSSEAVRQAIMAGALRAAEKMQAEAERTAKEILAVFAAIAEEYSLERDALLDEASGCGLEVSARKEQYAQRMQTLSAAVPAPAFGWAAPLWPKSADLMECNVIETIASGVKAALGAWEQDKREYTKRLRASLFGAARQETESLPGLCKAAAGLAQKEQETLTLVKKRHEDRQRELMELASRGDALLSGLNDGKVEI